MRDTEKFSELNLLNHLPSDRLKSGQRKEQFTETPSAVVLSVADVVFEVNLDLETQLLDAVRITEAFGI